MTQLKQRQPVQTPHDPPYNQSYAQTESTEPESWVSAVLMICNHYQLHCSEERIRLAASWYGSESSSVLVGHLARQAGLSCRFAELKAADLSPWRLPFVVQLHDGQLVVAKTINSQGEIILSPVTEQGLTLTMPAAALLSSARQMLMLRPHTTAADVRVDSYIAPWKKGWLKRLIVPELKPYCYVMLASMVANVLGLAGILFSMQVYDRVIPAQSMPTLYVLFIGVMLALLFSFLMNLMRSHITDVLGKRADIRVSDRVFGHALRLRHDVRPKSTGTFISQLRELEQVRELLTSSTVGALTDLPFFIVFMLVFYLIAAPLSWLPLFAVVLMLGPALLMQRQLARCAQMAMRESSLRNAVLVESIQALDDIKAMQAEHRFQQQWNQCNAVTAEASVAMRKRVHLLTIWSQTVQMGVFALVIVFGAPLVMNGDMTTGALVAASILSSRMLAPMGQLTSILTRWQQAKVAMQSLDSIMQLPTDAAEGHQSIHRSALHGNYQLQAAIFRHHREDKEAVLSIEQLQIRAGERIAVLGRNGAGKSSLLQALAGQLQLSSGVLMLDSSTLSQLDPADVRRDVGLLSQRSRLFHGTVRENLLLGASQASDQQVLEAMTVAGAGDLISRLSAGLDHQLQEGGLGLSGGQQQSLLVARLLLRQPQVLLLDEPSAALDDTTERQLISNLNPWLGQRTLVIATHRMAMLALVDRVLVLEAGRIVLDAPKHQAIAFLSKDKRA